MLRSALAASFVAALGLVALSGSGIASKIGGGSAAGDIAWSTRAGAAGDIAWFGGKAAASDIAWRAQAATPGDIAWVQPSRAGA
ncbi:hypothetical protein ACIOEZ_28170 [Streptomyces sp. NPDC087866]|uniref:hypothetical protein n=1 Tax=unclassified Streptomyces TaxID=2593676 RepID=UPI00224F57A8|nr:hypothetical protein [Streptomyces sp. NBC_01789]MCX4448286.1 hypothetical protein [Streptomyces sp. NBC_01789]